MYLFRINTKIESGRDRKIPKAIEKRGHCSIGNDVRESSLFYHIDNYFDEYAKMVTFQYY